MTDADLLLPGFGPTSLREPRKVGGLDLLAEAAGAG
jgi:hypothetical protein